MADGLQVLTQRIVGAHGAWWRVAYRRTSREPWRHVLGPGNRILRFTTESAARYAARYHAAKWENGS